MKKFSYVCRALVEPLIMGLVHVVYDVVDVDELGMVMPWDVPYQISCPQHGIRNGSQYMQSLVDSPRVAADIRDDFHIYKHRYIQKMLIFMYTYEVQAYSYYLALVSPFIIY
jgi:hypothetical protein